MTFQEFVASRFHVADIGTALGMPELFDVATPGFVYGDSDGRPVWFIQDPDHRVGGGGEYFTTIENTTAVGPLHEVERRLYLFAARVSPGWVDHDFVVVYPVFDDLDTRESDSMRGVIECVIDDGVRPRRVSDSLPCWITEWFLGNYENCPSNVLLDNWSHPAVPYFMV